MSDTSSLLVDIGLEICGDADKKNFILLYSATRKVSVDEFHSKCDEKGPTVTILYLKNNTIYGGYTSEDWSSDEKKTKADKDAFLFYKNDHADEKLTVLPIAEGMQSKAITCDANFGPTFGWGPLFSKTYDLQTFKKDSKPESKYEDGFLFLNGTMDIRYAYNSESRKIKIENVPKFPEEINESETPVHSKVQEQEHVADPLIIKRIDVYQVLDNQPWRKFPTSKDIEEMKRRLEDFKPVPRLGVKKYNILLLGSIGSGKSSFVNTLSTVFSGTVKSVATARGMEVTTSVTNQIHKYALKSKSGKKLNLQIFDIRGFSEERGYEHELEFILNGRLPPGYIFPDEASPVGEDTLISANLKNEMHLVCFVTGTSNIDTLTKRRRGQINAIKTCVNKQPGLPMVVIVTKFDELSERISKDANQVYRCPEAHDAVKKMAGFFGLEEKDIFPIVNYKNDYELTDGKDRLALQALDAMVRLTDNYIENHKGKNPEIDSWAERAKRLHIPRHKNEKDAMLIKLREEMAELCDKTLRILCVGAVNSGKSSFVDSISSTLRDEIYSKASGGYATGGKMGHGFVVSTTEKFQMYQLRYKQTAEDKLCSCGVFIGDLPGFQESDGIQLEAVEYVVQGHVPNKYKIIDGISRDSKQFKKRPEMKDRVNCICFVFDISTPADELPAKTVETFKSLQRWLQYKEIPFIVILTKGDLLKSSLGKYEVFENVALKDNKDKLIEMFGFKQSKLFPIVNYIHEDTLVPESDALLIAAFREILKLGKVYFEELEDTDTDTNDYETASEEA